MLGLVPMTPLFGSRKIAVDREPGVGKQFAPMRHRVSDFPTPLAVVAYIEVVLTVDSPYL